MLKSSLQNAPLLARLAALGHTDLVVIADVGLPCPPGVPVVDLSLVRGLPRFVDVLTALTDDVVFEGALMASEASESGPLRAVTAKVGAPELVPHEEFKARTADARLIVRTGETTPYANVALRCGVDF